MLLTLLLGRQSYIKGGTITTTTVTIAHFNVFKRKRKKNIFGIFLFRLSRWERFVKAKCFRFSNRSCISVSKNPMEIGQFWRKLHAMHSGKAAIIPRMHCVRVRQFVTKQQQQDKTYFYGFRYMWWNDPIQFFLADNLWCKFNKLCIYSTI